MPERVRAWTAPESLADLTLFSDWDSVASMIASLRIHLFEHGTVPVWNFSFCGGRPELAVPFSWAYTWPSLFAYAFEPNAAILAVWAVLTTVGVFSLAALLRRWTGSRLAAATGACLYAFNGYFAIVFVAGHVTFAFFHLVPLLMLLFERSFAATLGGRTPAGACALSTLAAFALSSGGLPHALFHFYPALVALILLRVAQATHRSGWGAALRAAGTPVVAHALGVWLAAYKLWPVMRWQAEFPRQGVYPESRGLLAVLDGMVGLVPGFLPPEFIGVPVGTTRHRTALLEAGYWIANCYENLTLPVPPVTAAVRAPIPLSTPPPARLEALGRDRLRLAFDPGYRGWIHVHLPVLEGFEYDAPLGSLRRGRAHFRADQLADHRLTIHARYAGPRDGFVATGLGCVATALFYGGWIERLRRAMGPTRRHEGGLTASLDG